MVKKSPAPRGREGHRGSPVSFEIKVLSVDMHPIVGAAMRLVLDSDRQLSVVATVHSLDERSRPSEACVRTWSSRSCAHPPARQYGAR